MWVLRDVADHLGQAGTLVVPTFHMAFSAGVPFHRQRTPARSMGVLAEYVRTLPHACRSPNPFDAITAVGNLSEGLCGSGDRCAFGAGSPFARLVEVNTKILLLGADFGPVSLAHYCEQQARVPYRTWHEHTGLYIDGREPALRRYRFFAASPAQCPGGLDFNVIGDCLRNTGHVAAAPLGNGWVTCCTAADYVTAAAELLRADPFALLVRSQGPAAGAYTGETRAGVPHGQGTYRWPDGSRYTGSWVNGVREGPGTFHFPDGARYVGEYRRNRRHGKGKLLGRQGERYEGDWQGGMRHGRGILVVPHAYRYQGEWSQGQRHGSGELVWPGGRYEGAFCRNRMHGPGVLEIDGVLRYRGEFRANGIAHMESMERSIP